MMILQGRNLDAACIGVRFEAGHLYFSCRTDSQDALDLLILPPQDPDYLEAMRWALANGYLN